jgi:ATP-dependent DNA helicase RecG
MSEEHAPDTLLKMSNEDLLKSIGALKDGKLSFGGLLIVGNTLALSKYIPNHRSYYFLTSLYFFTNLARG